MTIVVNSSDTDTNDTLASAKVGDTLEVSCTITEITGKRIVADATDAEINEPDESGEESGDTSEGDTGSESDMGGDKGMMDKGMKDKMGGKMPAAIIMFGHRK